MVERELDEKRRSMVEMRSVGRVKRRAAPVRRGPATTSFAARMRKGSVLRLMRRM